MTACTPLVVFTGQLDRVQGETARKDHADLIRTVTAMKRELAAARGICSWTARSSAPRSCPPSAPRSALELTDQAREKAKPYTDKAMEKAKEIGDQAKQAAERAGEAAKP